MQARVIVDYVTYSRTSIRSHQLDRFSTGASISCCCTAEGET
jgi:hypothetical protein